MVAYSTKPKQVNGLTNPQEIVSKSASSFYTIAFLIDPFTYSCHAPPDPSYTTIATFFPIKIESLHSVIVAEHSDPGMNGNDTLIIFPEIFWMSSGLIGDACILAMNSPSFS